MLKIRRMWKPGWDGIHFNNIFCIFVETICHRKIGCSPVIWRCYCLLYVSGMLASVPWVSLGPETPGNQFGMTHRDKYTKDIIKIVATPSAFPYAPDV